MNSAVGLGHDGVVSGKFPGFSCPSPDFDEDFAGIVAVEYAKGYVRRLVQHFFDSIQKCSMGLLDVFNEWLEAPSDFQTCWNIAFGEIRHLVQADQQVDFPSRIVALAIRLTECGFVKDWSCHWTEPQFVRYGGCLFGPATGVRTESTDRGHMIQMKIASSWCSVLRCGDPLGSHSMLPHFRLGNNRIFILTQASTMGIRADILGLQSRDTAISPFRETAIEAVALVRSHAPEYLEWIDRVLRHTVLVESDTELVSATDASQPGLVHMSDPGDPVILAEVLVHEAAHQYMNLLTRLGPVDDGSDAALYYSPVKKTGRPISAILTAYHAFGNVVKLYRRLEDACVSDGGYCFEQRQILVPQLSALESALDATRALTDVGRSLYSPLRDWLQEQSR